MANRNSIKTQLTKYCAFCNCQKVFFDAFCKVWAENHVNWTSKEVHDKEDQIRFGGITLFRSLPRCPHSVFPTPQTCPVFPNAQTSWGPPDRKKKKKKNFFPEPTSTPMQDYPILPNWFVKFLKSVLVLANPDKPHNARSQLGIIMPTHYCAEFQPDWMWIDAARGEKTKKTKNDPLDKNRGETPKTATNAPLSDASLLLSSMSGFIPTLGSFNRKLKEKQ